MRGRSSNFRISLLASKHACCDASAKGLQQLALFSILVLHRILHLRSFVQSPSSSASSIRDATTMTTPYNNIEKPSCANWHQDPAHPLLVECYIVHLSSHSYQERYCSSQFSHRPILHWYHTLSGRQAMDATCRTPAYMEHLS